MLLDAWRRQLVEIDELKRRIEQLRQERKDDVSKRTDDGWGSVPWRRVGLGRRGNGDSSD
jgi:hypothetical protein